MQTGERNSCLRVVEGTSSLCSVSDSSPTTRREAQGRVCPFSHTLRIHFGSSYFKDLAIQGNHSLCLNLCATAPTARVEESNGLDIQVMARSRQQQELQSWRFSSPIWFFRRWQDIKERCIFWYQHMDIINKQAYIRLNLRP